MVIAAGATRYSLVKFLIADGLAAIVSGGLFIALGHWVRVHLGSIDQLAQFRKEKIGGIEHWVYLGLGVVAVGVVGYIWWRKRTRVKPSEVLMDRTVAHVTHENGAADGRPKP